MTGVNSVACSRPHRQAGVVWGILGHRAVLGHVMGPSRPSSSSHHLLLKFFWLPSFSPHVRSNATSRNLMTFVTQAGKPLRLGNLLIPDEDAVQQLPLASVPEVS